MAKKQLKGTDIFEDDAPPVPSVPLDDLPTTEPEPIEQPTEAVETPAPVQTPRAKRKDPLETKLKGLYLDKEVISAIEFWAFFEKEDQSKLVNNLLRKHIPKRYFEMSRG